ncbi:MAG TPA: DegQ family serine endoprotease [Rhizomicrobium sp.]
MSDEKANLFKHHSRTIALGTAAALVLLGMSAFALVPGVRSADSGAASRLVAVAQPGLKATPPRMLENGAPFSFADLVERVSPAVVTITAETMETGADEAAELPAPFRDFFNQYGQGRSMTPHKAISAGSGFIIDRGGFVVTNNHVIANARKITVKLPDGRSYEAKLIGTDRQTDIALLKVKADKPLPSVEFGDDRQVRVGDWVVAVGNPYGLSNTVTAGIVSSLGRDLPGSGPYNDFIQIDAPINSGNSGGPTFDLRGQVIGMNSMIVSPTGGSVGIGFAIPATTIHDVVGELQSHGRVDRGYLGVNIQSVTPEIARSLNIANPKGAIVAEIVPGGPAATAGFQQGDVVVALNGRNVEDARDLTRHIAAIPSGAKASFTVIRNGQQHNISAKIGNRPDERVAANDDGDSRDAAQSMGGNAVEAMGLGLAAVTPETRRSFNIDAGIDGVLVVRVDPNSDAGDKGIQPGDVVLSVANKPVHNPRDMAAQVSAERSAGHRTVLLLIATQGATRFIAVDIGQA